MWNRLIAVLECSPNPDARVMKVSQKEAFDDQETKTTETRADRQAAPRRSGNADVRQLLAGFEELWDTIQPREQVRLTSLLVDRVDFDGVAGNVAITFHDTGVQNLTTGTAEALA